MANQITIDPTEYTDQEFSAEELDSIQVGEQLAQEQQALLAGKYENAEQLEQAYLELQRKLGNREAGEEEEEVEEAEVDTNEEPEEEYEVTPAVALIQEASMEYYQNEGQLSAETLEKFSELSSRDLVQAYMEIQAQNPQQEVEAAPDLSDRDINVIQNSVGGENAYQQLVTWAGDNLPSEFIQAFDKVVESGSIQAIQLAVAGLQREYENNVGYEGRLFSGKAAASPADVYRSQAEVVRAMSDSRYDNDPAYRQDVYDKLERSNINF